MEIHKKTLIMLFCIIILCLLVPGSAPAFNIPERLEYDLKWSGLKAGTAVLEASRDGEGIRIISTATSADWVSAFYRVEDRVESGGTYYRIKLKEGRHRRDREVIFDHGKKKALYMDHLGKERQEFDIPEGVFNPLSGFYSVRNMNLKIGKSIYLPVFDSKRTWSVEVQVLRKERLHSPLGTFDTIVIRPMMRSEGIFSRKGDIYIWLTDDAKKVPVQLKSKVVVGSVTAVLVGGKY